MLILAENSYYEYYKLLNKKIEIILNMPDVDALNSFYSEKRIKNEIFYMEEYQRTEDLKMYIKSLENFKK